MVTVIKQWCYTLYSSKVPFFFTVFKLYLSLPRGTSFYSVLSTALFWPVELCFLAVLHCTLLLEPANWWITLTDDPTQVNDNVLQKELQSGKFYYETAMRHFYSVASQKNRWWRNPFSYKKYKLLSSLLTRVKEKKNIYKLRLSSERNYWLVRETGRWNSYILNGITAIAFSVSAWFKYHCFLLALELSKTFLLIGPSSQLWRALFWQFCSLL